MSSRSSGSLFCALLFRRFIFSRPRENPPFRLPKPRLQLYLSNRSQSTHVNGTLSDYLPISCGVSQGSAVLGHLLFLIYINDLQECELTSSVLMYADDTSLTLSANDPTTLEEKLNKGRDKVQSNKPTLSDNKNLR